MTNDDTHRLDREDCFICSRGNPDILERHHIVPRRYGGSDSDENLVDLCPSCHRAIESLYDDRFWTVVGAVSEERQVDYIVSDIAERLSEFELEVSCTVSSLQSQLEGEYKGVDVDVARQRAIDRHLDDVEQNPPESAQTAEDYEKFAKVLTRHIDEAGEITESDAIEVGTSNGLGEAEALQLIDGIKDYGFALESSPNKIKVIVS